VTQRQEVNTMIERLTLILESMRPKQWTKNALLFAGILFSQNFLVLSMLTRVLCAFFVFCVLSGACTSSTTFLTSSATAAIP
jgi:4-hydroxybenzoate polyprenyltransferase